MSDYTPTTEEVRSAYADENQSYDDDWDDCVSQFDRWLAEVKKQEQQATEQRIIKLLQKEAVFCMLEKHVEDYVALIKGEK